MKLRLKKQAESKTIFAYGFGRNAKDNRPKAYEGSWRELVAHMLESTDADLYPSFTGSETKEQYAAKKTSLPYISAEFDGRRSNDGVLGRAFMFLDVDGVRRSVLRGIKAELRSRNLTYFFYTTTGDRHDLKDGLRCARFILPTDRVMAADEIYRAQCKFAHELGLWGAEGVDATAYERARIMFCPAPGAEVEQFDGRPVSVRRTLRSEFEPDSERGAGTVWTDEALANADDNSRAIADWCFEEGLEALPSGRGWAVECPNYGSHSDHDALDGSTAIMMPDQRNAEVRFACRHDHCRELNRHQHLALRLVGVPDAYLPEAHNISRAAIAELLPDVDADEVYEAEIAAVGATNTCTDDDLDDELEVTGDSAELPYWGNNFLTGRATCIVGASFTGKSSFITGLMGASSARANYGFGGVDVAKGVNIILAGEGYATALRQKQAAAVLYDDAMDNLHIVDMMDGDDADLMSDTWRKALARKYRGVKVACIAPDTLQTCCKKVDGQPFDEYNNNHMRKAAQAAEKLAKLMGCAVIFTAHPSKDVVPGSELPERKDRKPKGGGDMFNSLGTVAFLHVMNEDRPNELNLYLDKHKGYALWGRPMGFVLQSVELHKREEKPDTGRIDLPLAGYVAVAAPEIDNTHTGIVHPIGVAPFERASQAAEQAKKAVAASKSSTEDIVLAAIQSLPDCAEGFTRHQILQATGMPSLPLNKALRKLEDAGTIVRGRDAEGDREYTFREPTGINDRKPFAHKATDDDLA